MPAVQKFTTMRSLMTALARAMNLVNPAMENHHEQTAYLSYFIARELGFTEDETLLALYAALLHDIGSVVVEAPQSVAEIESNAREVALSGAGMLSDLPGFADIAAVIGYCQCSWQETLACRETEGDICARLGRIAGVVHLADAVSVAVTPGEHVLNQASAICAGVRSAAGTEFCPEAADAFLQIAGTEFIWMDLAHNPHFLLYFTGDIAEVSLEDAIQLTCFMSRVIDYRSPFTAMHSAGVAASARELARLAGMSDAEVAQMQIAGNLHDVGKLAVPRAILEKPGKLTDAEFNVVKEHPYYTSLVLMDVEGFETIRHWAAHHHEKLNEKGYPFHYPGAELDCGDRIMAVADIFSAITEDRPYREGMSREKAASVLKGDVDSGGICGEVVNLLLENYDQVNAARELASRTAGKRYYESALANRP